MPVCASNASSLDYSFRKIHEGYSGKLYTGFAVTAKSTSSIPTKYQTIRVPNSEKKGFNSQAQRFQYDLTENENPGPGSYEVSHASPENNSVSLSKKGTGAFPSKTSRMPLKKTATTPAANAYTIPASLNSRKDFSKGNSSMFQVPIAVKVNTARNATPAPNQYNASPACSLGSRIVTGRAAFLSKTRRDLPSKHRGPSPCHYKINYSLLGGSSTGSESCFKSKTVRSESLSPSSIGPGYYDPYGPIEPVKRIVYPRKHYLCISAPAMPVPKSPAFPGPGQYEIVDYYGPPKNYISSAVFVSNTSRWTGDITGKVLPGPGAYQPLRLGKQSFLSNCDRKWIPL
ncbi:O(6)-methylguanine-induced apoptosis 2 [Microcaecilia unicolor]|uniref:O(6)-methylguanine-induced apoptosis 2 n=1 Tax=Microcaecilia unicolor TaxID=1415580 RepID=A0A6P7ZLF6_9AMPH|nr:O(6)-methylguanine-induced apoptosis 2 [Microcaecilia unicolor]XP_030075580.1 O(6)-methylguanine-induced apoptosis 2 [Microcaecilia unicolor]XP_030075581.1 O(6)-methylguanine-induced apoptosis 2 [Microcaecilia unicolor]XP_030075582.1 O(6)-methylguanine-induced apoptosis 2 [Microcaecilia unicolor]